MGEIADSMINGELCAWCGVYLEPKETVYTLDHDADGNAWPDKKVRMPTDGSGFGQSVVCRDCKKDHPLTFQKKKTITQTTTDL